MDADVGYRCLSVTKSINICSQVANRFHQALCIPSLATRISHSGTRYVFHRAASFPTLRDELLRSCVWLSMTVFKLTYSRKLLEEKRSQLIESRQKSTVSA